MTVPTPGGEPVAPEITTLIPAADLGLGGLLAAVFLAVMSGLLVPRWTLTRLLAARDERIEELKGVLAKEQERNCLQSQQITALLETGRASTHALEAIRTTVAIEEQAPGEGA